MLLIVSQTHLISGAPDVVIPWYDPLDRVADKVDVDRIGQAGVDLRKV